MNTIYQLRLAGAALAAAMLATTNAHATTFGLSVDPMGTGWDRNGLNTGFAIWDTFPFTTVGANGPEGTFANDGPDSNFGLTSPLLSQSALGPLRTGSGDRVYSFGSTPVWTISADTLFPVKGFVLQIKQYQDPGVSFDTLYAPTLNGIAADYSRTDGFTEGANFNSVTTWWWGASLAAETITTINLAIADQSANHYSVDGFTIDAGTVSVVPEPTAISLLGGAGLLLLMRRRRGPVALAS